MDNIRFIATGISFLAAAFFFARTGKKMQGEKKRQTALKICSITRDDFHSVLCDGFRAGRILGIDNAAKARCER